MSRLELIPVTGHHAEQMFCVLSDQELYRFTGGEPPASLEAVRRWFTALETRKSPDGLEQWLTWIVRLADTKVCIGYVQATVKDGQADIAWLIGTEWQGRGLAKEAVLLMRDLLAANSIHRLEAHIHPEHVASQRVARCAGLSLTEKFADGEQIWVTSPAVV